MPQLAILAVALLACMAGVGNQFAHDDIHLILGNPRIQSLADWPTLLATSYWPPPYSQDLYRPLASLLLAVQYAVGGDDPLLFRLVSYTLYALCALALYRLSRDLLPSVAALAIALLFAAHPVHVEAVALAVAQNELMVGLLAVLATRHYLARRRASALAWRDWAMLAVAYAAACLFKEQGFVLPALLLAAELTLVAGAPRDRARALAPGYAILLVVGVAALLLRRAVLGELSGTFVAEAIAGLTPADRMLTMLQVVPQWLRLLAWPAQLQLDYSPQEIVASTGLGWREAMGVVLLAAVVVSAWATRRRAPVCTFGLAWCGIALLPVSNLVIPSGILLAERTLFLPSIGFLLAAGGAGVALAPHLAGRGLGGVREAKIALGVLVLLGVARSVERQRVWRNDGFLAVRTVQDAPRSYRAHLGFGDVLVEIGRVDQAEEAYDRAVSLAPERERWRVHNGAARVLRQKSLRELEVRHLTASLAAQREQEETRGHLAAAYLALGRYGDAARQADTALTLGGNRAVFEEIRAIADSAARTGAPAGSVLIRLRLGESRPVR